MHQGAGTKLVGVPSEPQNLEEDIRHRAYQLYDLRGREDGHDLDDWLRAEEDVRGKRTARAAA